MTNQPRKATKPRLDNQFVLHALLQHNYLPHTKKYREDLPPIISSTSFSEAAARELEKHRDDSRRNLQGYDAVRYKLTRYNGLSRVLSIPHPKAYAGLALSISNNWARLSYITENKISTVIPRRHSDGRLVIMDYDTPLTKRIRNLKSSFGFSYLVRTDISNFYPSIYSHSVPWALVGFGKAKESLGNKKREWYDHLDKAIRLTKRAETNGVAVGPATSIIVAEAILARVDRRLEKKYTYSRFADDYTAFCSSQEESERFILDLSEELARYELSLNIGKTSVASLPVPTNPDWIVRLRQFVNKAGLRSSSAIINYLDSATSLAKMSPDGSVIKYAFRSLINKMPSGIAPGTGPFHASLQYAFNLSFHHPVLVPLLNDLFSKFDWSIQEFPYGKEIQTLMDDHLRLRRFDAVSWLLYFSIKYKIPVLDQCATEIMKTKDCILILLLYLTDNSQHRRRVVRAVKRIAKNASDLYQLDQYWLLLYQLYLDNRIPNPYQKSLTFEILKRHAVSFVEPSA